MIEWRAGLGVGMAVIAVLAGCDEAAEKKAAAPAPYYAVDGDTISVEGRPHALAWIDAPELGQRCEAEGALTDCGARAGAALAKVIALNRPDCQTAPENEYHCTVGTENLAEILLNQGLVIATSAAPEAYRVAEAKAKEEGLGLWRGQFIEPERWRAGQRLDAERAKPSVCPVIGFERGDRKVFMTATHPGYKKAVGDDAVPKERFCGDEEARAAGYVWLRVE